MLNLIKLEIRRIKIGTYILASVIANVILVGFIYFVSYVAQVENELDFKNYTNIFLFVSIVSMIIYCVLSAVMYSRFIIEEYSGKRLLLMFSYPVNRKKVLFAKITLVAGFTTFATIASNIPPFVIFTITESISPIVDDTLSLELLLSIFKTIIVLAIAVNGISIIAMRIGFIKKSISTTIVTAFILCALVGNAVIGSYGNNMLLVGLLLVITAAGVIVALELSNKINEMEIE